MNKIVGGSVVVVLAIVLISAAVAQTPSRFLAMDTVLQGEDFGDLRWPVGVAVASIEQIGVADAFDKRLVVFVLTSGTWKVDQTITLPTSPRSLAHDGQRYLASLSDGGLVSVEGDEFKVRRLALPPGTVAGPVAARPGGGFLVLDAAGGKVLVLEADGEVSGEVAIAGSPKALASAPDGGFYTAHPDIAEVRRHDPKGEVVRRWTVPGEGPVPAWPSGLLVAPGGDLVVVDRHGGRILALDSAGRLEGIGSGRGWQPGELMFPSAIAEFPDGRVVVADQGNSRIQIFRPVEKESNAMKSRLWITLLILLMPGIAGAQEGLEYVQSIHMPSRADDFSDPRSVTADLQTGEIFVCDLRNNRVVIFDSQGLFLYMIPGGEIFRTPLDIAVDPEGYILLLARSELVVRLLLLDFDGKFIEFVDLSGLPASVQEPQIVSIAMSTDGEQFYVLDEANLHVWITNRTGEVVGMINLAIEMDSEKLLEQVLGHVDVYGDTVLVPVPTQGTVYLYDLDGKSKGWVGIRGTAPCQTMFPVAAALDDDGRAVVVDLQRMMIMIWDTGNNTCLGEYSGIGNRPGFVYQPHDLTLDAAGRVYVSQIYEGRVQVWAGSHPAAGTATRR